MLKGRISQCKNKYCVLVFIIFYFIALYAKNIKTENMRKLTVAIGIKINRGMQNLQKMYEKMKFLHKKTINLIFQIYYII